MEFVSNVEGADGRQLRNGGAGHGSGGLVQWELFGEKVWSKDVELVMAVLCYPQMILGTSRTQVAV